MAGMFILGPVWLPGNVHVTQSVLQGIVRAAEAKVTEAGLPTDKHDSSNDDASQMAP